MENKSNLPQYFVVKRDDSKEWKKYTKWLVKEYDCFLFGDGYNYYGYDGNEISCWNDLDMFKNNPHVFNSAKEFFECLNKEVAVEEKSEGNSQKLIRRFVSGAVRSNDKGRIRPEWVSPYAIEEISKLLVDNENDFGGNNYMLGIDEEACLSSLHRHYLELQEALLITKDKTEALIAARSVGFNIVAMLHTMVLKEKGLYKELYDKTELVTVEEAKKCNSYVKK